MKNKIYIILALTFMIKSIYANQEDSTKVINSNSALYLEHSIKIDNNEATNAIETITNDKLMHKRSINNSNMLFGLGSGLQVIGNSNNSWNDGATLSIRGWGTSSSNSPLILIDGFERSLDEISGEEIESITILKDASTAIYGIKGANGVILINTKRGKVGKPQINVSYNFNIGKPIRTPDMVDGYTFANALNESLINDGKDARYNSTELELFKTQGAPQVYPNVNWWNESIRNQSYGNNLTVSATGGNSFVRYYTQLNYLNNNGILQNTDLNEGYSNQFKYSKLNIRTNLDIDVTPTTKTQLNLYGNFSEHNRPGSSTASIFEALYQVPSGAFPIRTTNDMWGGSTIYSNNPMALISGTGYARSQVRTMYADIKIEQDLRDFIEGLKIGANLALDNTASYWDSNTKNFGYSSTSMNWDNDEIENKVLRNEGSLSFSRSVGTSMNQFSFNSFAKYNKEIDKHKLDIVLSYNLEKRNVKGQNNSRAFMDVIGHAHYLYDNKYILDLSISRSGSSVLKPSDRWGTFPSIGAAWIVSKEDYFKADWINQLKLRASYGISGLANYGVDLFLDKYGTGGSYPFGNNPSSISGLKITQLGINDLTYEKSHKLNIGADINILDKLSITLDGYHDHRTDILVSGSNAVSSIFGLSIPSINNGVIDSYGFESSINWASNIGSFKYEVGGIFNLNKNKIINNNEEYRPYEYLKRTGNPIGQFFGYEVVGIFKDQAEIDQSPIHNISNIRPGDFKYKDQNDDGIIDSYDQVALGYTRMPEIYYAFNLNFEYKNVGLYTLFQGAERVSTLLNTPSLYWPIYNNRTISTEYYNNRWTETNPNGKYPRLTSEGSDNNYTTNSFWVQNASYLKLRTLELYYNLPVKNNNSYQKDKLRLFVRAHDILSIDSLKIVDPENIGANHPSMSEIVLGFNLTF